MLTKYSTTQPSLGQDGTYTLPSCEVCDHQSVPPLLDLGSQAMCDDLVAVGDDRRCQRYPIEISICPNCLTAHQVHRIKKEVLFPTNYHYRPRFTQDVLDGMATLVDEIEGNFGSVGDKRVVDVGCNDGSLLSIFKKRGALTAGIEPTGASVEAEAAGHAMIHGFFLPESASELVQQFGTPDIVTFTNVFAHIESLPQALDAVKALVKDETILVIENHYLGTVLRSFQFDTFYHEHPRTYSRKSFEIIAESLGGELLSVSFPSRYGGNIRVAIGNFNGKSIHPVMPSAASDQIDESQFPAMLERMQRDMVTWQTRTRQKLDELKTQGVHVHGKSFPGRAAILAHLLEVDCNDQPVVYEKPGSLKIGHYLPGTRIEIVSDQQWINGSEHPDAMFIWGWHICDEIAKYLREGGFQGRLFSPLPEFHEITATDS